jgi:mono/diheme cytochrome c family protein
VIKARSGSSILPVVFLVFVITASLAIGAPAQGPQAPGATDGRDAAASTQRAFIDQYCVTCHNDRTKTANLVLDKTDLAQVGDHSEVWEKVVRKLRAGMMPPSGARRPDRASAENFTVWLEAELDRAAVSKPNPGAPSLHRLNRTEYANSIRDLIALDIDANTLLPPDDSSYGFDNIASALGMSPALMERYLSASGKISRWAIGDASVVASSRIYAAPVDLTQNYHVEGLPFGTRGGMIVRHFFPVDGEYTIATTLSKSGLQAADVARAEQLEVSINGDRVRLFDLQPGAAPVDDEAAGGPSLQVRVPIKAGFQSIGVTFVAKNYAPTEDTLQPYLRSIMPGNVWTVVPHVGAVTIAGPLRSAGVGTTPSRQKIFICRPDTPSRELPCAREVISTLARRAYRQPVSAEDMRDLMMAYDSGRENNGFDGGVEWALRRILASPKFIFRFEREPANVGQTYRISDLELASRLSFFLWSSIPDDELIRLASQGRLRDSAVLDQQVRRMLADPRSQELAKNFAAQWLYLRNLQSIVPAMEEFPDFDDNLRQAFRLETEMFFESIIRENRNVIDLLTADYTFLNERLARHYGIPKVYGGHFRRVKLGADDPRKGLLGHGSILTVTSLATRTSPVLRGKWILENILGTPPPEPPPNVPALQENPNRPSDKSAETLEVLSVRQRMEQHRINPACVSCHKMMDPIGFALENFDAVGQWRTKDGRSLVDPSGELVDGTKIQGPANLRQALLRYSDQFVRTVTERLLTYGLGRGVEHYDMPVVRSVVRDAARDNYRFASLISGIVKSAPFQMKMKQQESAAVRE